jgi:hypothetical protein
MKWRPLWRNRAAEFTVHEVYDATEKNPMVILLVGTLPKDLLRWGGEFAAKVISKSFSGSDI